MNTRNDLTKTKSSEDDRLLDRYKEVGKVVAQMFHPLLEVIVHDYRIPQNSVVAAFNAHITGREIGDPITSLGKERLAGEGSVPDTIVNYENETPDGRPLKSSSIAIRNDSGEYVGSLCFNFSTDILLDISHLIQSLVSTSEELPKPERFTVNTPREEIQNTIRSYIIDNAMQSKSLSGGDKQQIVEHLRNRGLFNQRGAVTLVAQELNLSRPSVYRYLQESTAK
ncbi:MAG: PAS domain-containing protein [Bdellovibrionales bacterium]|nr:PAS domain-containing protein [Bdellovibrionales bacterium]